MKKNLQMKYNLLHIFYWMAYCAILGYVAVLMQYKGMSNTLIGVTTGIGSAMTMVTTPWVSGLVGRIEGLTLRRIYVGNFIGASVLFAALVLLPMPSILIMILFIIAQNLIAANVPLLTMVCMNCLRAGDNINFGMSRGLGSVSYATAAVVYGVLIEGLSPVILGWAFVIASILVMVIMVYFPDPVDDGRKSDSSGSISMPAFVMEYKVYIFLLFAISLQFAAATALSTYLINIVSNLGGTTSLYGIAVFCMAASELPFMAATPKLREIMSTETLLFFAAIMYIVRNVMIATAPNLVILMIGMAMQGASYGIFTAAITYYVHDRIKFEHGMMGQTMIAVMTTGFGSTMGNVLGGILQDSFGLNAMLHFTSWTTIAGGLICAAVIYVSRKQNR